MRLNLVCLLEKKKADGGVHRLLFCHTFLILDLAHNTLIVSKM